MLFMSGKRNQIEEDLRKKEKKLKDKQWTYYCNNGDMEYLRRKKIEGNNSQKWPAANGQDKANNTTS